MADVVVGDTGITWGTTDETMGYVESLTTTDEGNKEEVVDGDGDIVTAIYHGLKTTMAASLVALTAAHGLTVGGDVTINSVVYFVDSVATTYNRAGLKTYEIAGWTSATCLAS